MTLFANHCQELILGQTNNNKKDSFNTISYSVSSMNQYSAHATAATTSCLSGTPSGWRSGCSSTTSTSTSSPTSTPDQHGTKIIWSILCRPIDQPLLGNYQDALAYFCLVAGVNPTPQVAANHIYHASAQEPVVLIILIHDAAVAPNDPGTVHVYHHTTLYFTQMGKAMQWDNQAFAFFGNLVMQQVQSIIVPSDLFNQVNAFNVPNTAALQAAFAADLVLALAGLYTNNNPDTDQYCTRQVIHLCTATLISSWAKVYHPAKPERWYPWQ